MKNVNNTIFLFLQDNTDGWKKAKDKSVFPKLFPMEQKSAVSLIYLVTKLCMVVPALEQTETF